jgi:hypothetical protein
VNLTLLANAAGSIDAQGQPVRGNSGGNYVTTLSHNASATVIDVIPDGGELP